MNTKDTAVDKVKPAVIFLMDIGMSILNEPAIPPKIRLFLINSIQQWI